MRAADRQAFQGWQQLLAAVPDNLDRAWVALTGDPRHVDQRQHPLKGQLGIVKVGGLTLEQWQYEVTGAGRIWYAVDDDTRTIWITRAGAGPDVYRHSADAVSGRVEDSAHAFE